MGTLVLLFFLSVFNFGGVRLLVFRCAPKPLLLARATGGDQIGGSGVGAERGFTPPGKADPLRVPHPPGHGVKSGARLLAPV